ncbi:GerAB/ArcD/ProY family transporter [Alkaliphilus serpentinus]|uniref:GerAB/ArcD/ProY family transporter n=1 Tax=Alkaliphilus serpentinus TaxID=1482731 RepID=A0A833M8C6_9FIRM|nr:endospore germination permease [Alkaliphilus serpentinus]KAB3532481.1 GerAB/ArcD/ProY family transporter [Alkaliphilus serpentinus]
MYQNNDKISISQITSILILTLVGTGILTLPQALAEEAATNGWIIIIVGTLSALLVAFLHSYIVKSFPGKGLFEILEATLGKPVAHIIGAIFSLYFIVINSFLLRIFGEVVKMFLLFRTPIEVIMFFMLATNIYLVRRGIETLARLAELLLPLILIPSLVLFLLTIQGTDFSNLLPVFQLSVGDIIKALPIVFFSFLGFDLILVFGRFVKPEKNISKAMAISILVVGLLYVFLNTITLARFGVEQTVHLIWPTLTIFKTIEFPGLFIENVEAIVMVLWVFIVFMSMAPLFLGATITLSNSMNIREHGFLALPLIPIIYFISLFPDSVTEAYYYLDYFTKFIATSIIVIIPLIIAMVIVFKRGIRKEDQGA